MRKTEVKKQEEYNKYKIKKDGKTEKQNRGNIE
jgi:hypothetical protein